MMLLSYWLEKLRWKFGFRHAFCKECGRPMAGIIVSVSGYDKRTGAKKTRRRWACTVVPDGFLTLWRHDGYSSGDWRPDTQNLRHEIWRR